MSIDIPFDLIHKVQTQIRQQSPFSSFHPDDQSLPPLPSIQDVIADFDTSPSYLRCKRCKGSFLSGGLQSLFCVYCGDECHDPELPPDSIKFNSTLAYRWLLQSLKLDGSEIVGQGKVEDEPNRNLASPKKELKLYELLDLEIRWPRRPKKVAKTPTGDQLYSNSSSVSLTSVNVENFFPSLKSVSAIEKPSSVVPNDGIDSTGDQGHEDVDLFANVASMEIGANHNTDGPSDDFSGWETQFQGSTSVNSLNEKLSFDSFGVSSELSAQNNTAFVSEKVEKSIIGLKDPSPSNSDWNEEDVWSNFNSDKLEAHKHELDNASRKLDISSDQIDEWGLNGKWQTSSGKVAMAVADSVNVADNDSYDTWNDFTTSSSKSKHQYNGSTEPLSSEAQATKIDLFGSNDLQHDILGDFRQSGLFSSSLTNISTGTNQLQPEANVSDRVIDFNFRSEELDAEKKSVDDVETLMSQMHDLSFMLESNLVIPKATT